MPQSQIQDMKRANEHMESKLVAAQQAERHFKALLDAEKIGRAQDKENHEKELKGSREAAILHIEKKGEELAFMRAKVDEKDKNMMNMHLGLMSMAHFSGDDRLRIALQTQSQQTLSLVNGLKAEVAEKDDEIKQLRAKLAEAQAYVKRMQDAIDEGLEYYEDADRAIDAATVAEQRAAAAEQRLADAEQRAAAANQRAIEARELAEQQQHLISKLVKKPSDMRF
ncbi:hypothetical protein PRZ48_008064 [Zasmidium cellare]|uniref:Uncharacterized protein n=1 Tax=Zasmidium cellare TaxID=395010 RepID=A0ABR0EFA3_ZASCE|nr:hypothetical protein PRZ48_008064 [Zasmidium cellare]